MTMHLQERTVPRATLSNGLSGDTSRCVGLDGKSSAALCIVIGSLCPCTTQKEKSSERMARRYDMHLAQSADADRMPSGGSEHSTAGACFRMPDNGWLCVVFDTCIAEGG